QQLDREPDPAHCPGPQELAVRWLPASGPACGRCYEFDPVSEDEWARSVCLCEGRPHAPAHASESPDRRTVAAKLGTCCRFKTIRKVMAFTELELARVHRQMTAR